jgi:hypothetical protein
MVVSFFDLLGFNQLVQTCPCFAGQNFDRFNHILKQMYYDGKQNNPTDDFFMAKCFTKPNNIISMSDSVIMTADDADAEWLVIQLCEFINKCFVANEEVFVYTMGNSLCGYKTDDSIYCTKNDCNFPFAIQPNSILSKEKQKEYEIEYKELKMKNSILFRGGIRIGNQVNISKFINIIQNEPSEDINLFGYDYVKTVSLEQAGKGARLFCDNTILDALPKESLVKKSIREIDIKRGIYEIHWSYIVLEYMETSGGWSKNKARDRVAAMLGVPIFKENKMSTLEYAVELLRIYKNCEPCENASDEELKSYNKIIEQYDETLKSVALGIYKYAVDNNINEFPDKSRIIDIINDKICPLIKLVLDENSLNDFLEDV